MCRTFRIELFAFIKFALIALVFLPFLPDRGMGPIGVLNPQGIGLVVVVCGTAQAISRAGNARPAIRLTSVFLWVVFQKR